MTLFIILLLHTHIHESCLQTKIIYLFYSNSIPAKILKQINKFFQLTTIVNMVFNRNWLVTLQYDTHDVSCINLINFHIKQTGKLDLMKKVMINKEIRPLLQSTLNSYKFSYGSLQYIYQYPEQITYITST